MSKLLFVAAVACLLSVASAQSVIYNQIYTNNTCSVYTTNVTVATAGVCARSNDYSSTKYLCDANTVQVLSYNNGTCADSELLSVTNYPIACNQLASGLKYACSNPAAATAPIAFPGGFAQATTCVNSTTTPYSSTCATSVATDLKCTNSATNVNKCQRTGFATSRRTTCSGSFAGSLSYSDATCTTAIKATLSSVGCVNNNLLVCPGGVSVPSTLSAGVQTFQTANCAAINTARSSITLVAPATCVDQSKYTCATNTTTNVVSSTFSTFPDTTCSLTATSSTTQVNGVCTTTGVSSSNKYLCNYGATPNAASTAASSLVAMVAAAFVALMATRSL